MGIYIEDMQKPKRCGKCDLWSNCFFPKNPYTEQDDYIAPDCPLEEVDDIAFGLYKAYIDGIDTKPTGRLAEEPKTGHWIMHIDDLFPADSTQECSECHEWQYINGNDDNYCPNCGAKMEGETYG